MSPDVGRETPNNNYEKLVSSIEAGVGVFGIVDALYLAPFLFAGYCRTRGAVGMEEGAGGEAVIHIVAESWRAWLGASLAGEDVRATFYAGGVHGQSGDLG